MRKTTKILVRVTRYKAEIGIDHLTGRNPACHHWANGPKLLAIKVLCRCFEVLCRITLYKQNKSSRWRVISELFRQQKALHHEELCEVYFLFTSCRSLRSIWHPFRGFLVWRCALCSSWPVHWLHKFYSSWYDCQSHLRVNQETWVRNDRWSLLTKHLYSCP
jgi:hypothetical protein